MKIFAYLFLLLFAYAVPLAGQTQYTSVPRSGEGRFDRAESTTFWVNPIFLKPSVFFSSTETSTRANRKWWRNSEPSLPVPYTAHGYLSGDLPKDIALMNVSKMEQIPNREYREALPLLPQVNFPQPILQNANSRLIN